MPACAADIRPAYAPSLIPWLARFARVGTRAEVERISRALATLNGRVYEDLIPMLDDIGLAHDLHREGALTLYETEAGYRRDSAEWSCKQARGIEVHEVSGAQVREMEPATGPRVHRAIFKPQWSYLSDPRKRVARLRDWLTVRGARIVQGEVINIAEGSPTLSVEFERSAPSVAGKYI